MKKLLFVNACVRSEHSRTLHIAERYIDTLKAKDDIEVTEKNLCRESLSFITDSDFDPESGELRSGQNAALAREFAEADEIVIAAPFWEFMFPAIFSCYLEAVSIPGIVFEYTPEGSRGLCRAESLTYIYSAGNVLSDRDKLCEEYMKRMSELYGIENFVAVYADGLDIETNSPEDIVREVCMKLK